MSIRFKKLEQCAMKASCEKVISSGVKERFVFMQKFPWGDFINESRFYLYSCLGLSQGILNGLTQCVYNLFVNPLFYNYFVKI